VGRQNGDGFGGVERAAATQPEDKLDLLSPGNLDSMADDVDGRLSGDAEDLERQSCTAQRIEPRGMPRRLAAEYDEGPGSKRSKVISRLSGRATAKDDAAGGGKLESRGG
jgi:hypothetical protein